jgi:hypothetical protein
MRCIRIDVASKVRDQVFDALACHGAGYHGEVGVGPVGAELTMLTPSNASPS